MPAPMAMMMPTRLTARSATTPPRKADRNAAAETRKAATRHRARPSAAWQSRTDPEQLESVIVDPEPGLAGDVADDRAQARVVDLAGPPTARADHVMVMRGLAADVGVLAVRQVEPFDCAEPFQEVEGPEDGGPPDGGPGCLRGRHQLGGREMAVLLGDQRGQCASRLRHAVTGAVEGSHDRGGVAHGGRLAQLRHSLINTQGRPAMGHRPARS